jgi:hypothetical protein
VEFAKIHPATLLVLLWCLLVLLVCLLVLLV